MLFITEQVSVDCIVGPRTKESSHGVTAEPDGKRKPSGQPLI